MPGGHAADMRGGARETTERCQGRFPLFADLAAAPATSLAAAQVTWHHQIPVIYTQITIELCGLQAVYRR